MAHIVPSIRFVKDLKLRMRSGESIYHSLEFLCSQPDSDLFYQKMKIWWNSYRLKKKKNVVFTTSHQKTLAHILTRGLKGAPIYDHLIDLEKEMVGEFDRQWKSYLEAMPFRLMIPLLLFFFPAYLVLLFGPLFIQFLDQVSP